MTGISSFKANLMKQTHASSCAPSFQVKARQRSLDNLRWRQEQSRSVSLSHSHSLYVCVLPCAEKNETLQPPFRPSRSNDASDFTPCQTPRCPALREQRQLLNLPSTGHAEAGKQNAPKIDTRTHGHVHTLHTLPSLPRTWCLESGHKTEGWQCNTSAAKRSPRQFAPAERFPTNFTSCCVQNWLTHAEILHMWHKQE